MSSLSRCLVAHRGYQHHFPENTLSALKAAVAEGVHHLEIDIQLSADGVPMVYHDLSLKRTSGMKGMINHYSAAQLTQFNAAEEKRLGDRFHSEPIPQLSQVVAWLQTIICDRTELTLFVELKEESIEHQGIQTMLDAVLPILEPIRSHAVLISFDEAVLQAARSRWPTTGLILRGWPAKEQSLTRVQPDYLILNHRHIGWGQRLDNQPLPVMVYEISSIDQARHWLERGATLLESFSVGELIQAAK